MTTNYRYHQTQAELPIEGHCGCMEHAGYLEANWPLDCRNAITVSYQIDQLPADLWSRSLTRALDYWQAALDVKFVVLPQFTKTSRIWITDGPLPGVRSSRGSMTFSDPGAPSDTCTGAAQLAPPSGECLMKYWYWSTPSSTSKSCV